jgi:hypothetical protein
MMAATELKPFMPMVTATIRAYRIQLWKECPVVRSCSVGRHNTKGNLCAKRRRIANSPSHRSVRDDRELTEEFEHAGTESGSGACKTMHEGDVLLGCAPCKERHLAGSLILSSASFGSSPASVSAFRTIRSCLALMPTSELFSATASGPSFLINRPF